MLPRQSNDLIILAILYEHPSGLSGYSLVKEFKLRFGSKRALSAGTMYPKLKNLKRDGFIDTDEGEKLFTITEKGRKELMEKIPGLLESSLDFIPKLYNVLMKTLPFGIRMDYISDFSRFFGCKGQSSQSLFDESMFAEDVPVEVGITGITGLDNSIEKLESIKEKLKQTKIRIIESKNQELNLIDEKIKSIDEKIHKCHDEKSNWKKISIDDGD